MLRTLSRQSKFSTPLQTASQQLRSVVTSSVCCQPNLPPPGEVPDGHKNSDLRNIACNIGLNRRRDLSLRADVCLFQPGRKATVRELFRGQTIGVFGVPDMGKVCSNQHVPSFLEKADELKAAGLDRIMCIAVDTPEAVEQWASSVKLSGSKIEVWADTKGYWTRMLGLDIEQPDAQGPKSFRYAALVENGILLKLMVEQKLGTVSESTADVLLSCIKKLEALKSQNKDPVGKI